MQASAHLPRHARQAAPVVGAAADGGGHVRAVPNEVCTVETRMQQASGPCSGSWACKAGAPSFLFLLLYIPTHQ